MAVMIDLYSDLSRRSLHLAHPAPAGSLRRQGGAPTGRLLDGGRVPVSWEGGEANARTTVHKLWIAGRVLRPGTHRAGWNAPAEPFVFSVPGRSIRQHGPARV